MEIDVCYIYPGEADVRCLNCANYIDISSHNQSMPQRVFCEQRKFAAKESVCDAQVCNEAIGIYNLQYL